MSGAAPQLPGEGCDVGRGFIEYRREAAEQSEFVAYSAFLDYRLPDGSTLGVDQQPAWCRGCGQFVLAERLPEVAELDELLAAVKAREPETVRRLTVFGRSAEDEVAELTRRIAWRRGRQSPARCLHCGSGQIVALPSGGEFAHPATGERVTVVGSGFASMARWVAEFSSEGIKLGSQDDRHYRVRSPSRTQTRTLRLGIPAHRPARPTRGTSMPTRRRYPSIPPAKCGSDATSGRLVIISCSDGSFCLPT